MSPFTLMRKIVSPLLLLNIISRYKGRSSLIKIKAAQLYVQGVQKARILFLGSMLVLFSLVFLAGGLSLIHTALFTYSMWSVEMKFIVALLLGGVESVVAIGILFYLSREEAWAKFAGIPKVLDSAVKSRKSDSYQ